MSLMRKQPYSQNKISNHLLCLLSRLLLLQNLFPRPRRSSSILSRPLHPNQILIHTLSPTPRHIHTPIITPRRRQSIFQNRQFVIFPDRGGGSSRRAHREGGHRASVGGGGSRIVGTRARVSVTEFETTA